MQSRQLPKIGFALGISLSILLTSCKQKNSLQEGEANTTENPFQQNDSTAKNKTTKASKVYIPFYSEYREALAKKEREERDKEIKNASDSARISMSLTEALDKAYRHIKKERFDKKYEVEYDSSWKIKVEIHFRKKPKLSVPHLIIKREARPRHEAHYNYADIYKLEGGKFVKILSDETWYFDYTKDYFRDINRDGYLDFVVQCYGMNGCCLNAYHNVYLFRPQDTSYRDYIEFTNPTFSPSEKIVRGVEYGHPGETEMYKYKWDGEKLDTVEYISFERDANRDKTGKILVTSNYPSHDNLKVLKRLNAAPKEYRKIKGYDWFTGKGY